MSRSRFGRFYAVLIGVSTITLMNSCASDVLKEGRWAAELDIGDGLSIPFEMNFDETHVYLDIWIENGDEVIQLDAKRVDDSVFMKFPVFDSEIRAAVTKQGRLHGYWYNHAKGNYKLPFSARPVSDPTGIAITMVYITGKWEVQFAESTDNAWPAVGVFNQEGNLVTGTFLTESGDYRYLQGKLNLNKLSLSTFDGAHAFLFTAKTDHDEMKDGKFYSGDHYQTDWTATRNEAAALSDPDEMTYLKPGESFQFEFPDRNFEKTWSYPSETFNGEVTVVQILGSWCPNCMDETRFFTSLDEKYHFDGLNFIAIAFERPTKPEEVSRILNKYAEDLDVNYPIAYGGEAKKEVTSAAFSMLNEISSYPTTIVLDKKGDIRRIHTGFLGPGTGKYYEDYRKEMEAFLLSLMNE